MRDIDTAIRQLMRLIGRTVRPCGFRGSVDRWWTASPLGAAVITRVDHRRDATGVRFGLTGTTIPAEWWRYQNWCRAARGLEPLPMRHPHVRGIDLIDRTYYSDLACRVERRAWDLRVEPRGGAWPGVSEADLARAAAEVPVVAAHLMNRSVALLRPGAYVRELIDDPEHGPDHWEPTAILLVERGDLHDDDLDDVMRRLVRSRATTSDGRADRVLAYVTERIPAIRSIATTGDDP